VAAPASIGNADSATEYQGRRFPANFDAGLMSFGQDSLELELAFAFDVRVNTTYGWGRIADFVFADDGDSVVIAAEWESGVEIGDQLVEAGRNHRGVALVKVNVAGP